MTGHKVKLVEQSLLVDGGAVLEHAQVRCSCGWRSDKVDDHRIGVVLRLGFEHQQTGKP